MNTFIEDKKRIFTFFSFINHSEKCTNLPHRCYPLKQNRNLTKYIFGLCKILDCAENYFNKILKTAFVDFDTLNYFKIYLLKIIKLNSTQASTDVFFEQPRVNKFKQLFHYLKILN